MSKLNGDLLRLILKIAGNPYYKSKSIELLALPR